MVILSWHMRKLYSTEKLVLSRLIFVEPYEVLLKETGLAPGTLKDDLINLINHRLIEVVNKNSQKLESTNFYDFDNLHNFSFRLTKMGLKSLTD